MTADNAPASLTASASSQASVNWPPWKAFAGYLTGQGWIASTVNAWLQIDLGPGGRSRIDSYTLTSISYRVDDTPTAWTIAGSNDGSAWTTLDTRTGETSVTMGSMRTYQLSAVSAPWRYFRITVTATVSGWNTAITQLEFLAPPFVLALPMRGRPRMR